MDKKIRVIGYKPSKNTRVTSSENIKSGTLMHSVSTPKEIVCEYYFDSLEEANSFMECLCYNPSIYYKIE